MSSPSSAGPPAREDDVLLQDVRAVMDEPTVPPGYARRVHEAIDAGYLDPVARRRVWPTVVAPLALAAAALLWVALPWLRSDTVAPPGDTPGDWTIRGADGPPPVAEMSALAVSADGEVTDWVHAGEQIPADGWLRLHLEAPPGVFLAVVRKDAEGTLELFYRWPEEAGAESHTARDGDVWYALEELEGEQSFVCIASDARLDDGQARQVIDGDSIEGVRVHLESLPVRVGN